MKTNLNKSVRAKNFSPLTTIARILKILIIGGIGVQTFTLTACGKHGLESTEEMEENLKLSSSSFVPSSSSSVKQSSSSSKPSSSSSSPVADCGSSSSGLADDSYLTQIEKDVIMELNLVRSNPKEYAELHIKPMLNYFNDKIYSEPGRTAILTNEGVAAVQECITVLSQAESVGILTSERGLYLAAKDHVADQSITGQTGHTGGDGSDMISRLRRYGYARGAAGETLDYGGNTGREIVTDLLIDDGVPSRGHRTIIMNGIYTQVGVSVGTHPTYGNMCVIDYANNYTSNYCAEVSQ